MMTDKDLVRNRSVKGFSSDRYNIPKNKQAVRTLVKKVHEEYLTEERLDIPRKEKVIKPMYYYIAASILAIAISIGVYFNFVLPAEQIDTEKLYTEFYQPYQLKNEVIESNSVHDDDLRVAYIAYANTKFALASELFSRVLEKNPELLNVVFLRGVASMETSQHKQSIESFKKIIHHNSPSEYLSLAHWYTALTWIKLNNPGEAKENLNWLVENDPQFSKQAANLLVRLEK